MSTSSSRSPEVELPRPLLSAFPLLNRCRAALAVVAHPDDESYGLGAVLSALTDAGVRVSLLCFTAGEASTLGWSPDLATRRREELVAAARELKLADVWLEKFADLGLATLPPSELTDRVLATLGASDLVVCFEDSGVTGHPDHVAATRAAREAAAQRGLPLLEWGVPGRVADRLDHQFHTHFGHIDDAPAGSTPVLVDRSRQLRAIACHRSQAPDNPLLRKRLELLGETEWLRLVPGPGPARL